MFEVFSNNLHSSDLVLAPVVIWLSFFHMKAPFTVEDSSSAAPKISFLQNNNNNKNLLLSSTILLSQTSKNSLSRGRKNLKEYVYAVIIIII